jgi:glycerol-3-phosphate acyltransferase PlsX
MAASLFGYGRIKGIDRPAIASPMPTASGRHSLIVDAGANSDVKPVNMLQFALMGSIYMNKINGIDKPTVGLINIGEEDTKGNELCIGTYPLLAKSGLNFVGNIEGRDIPQNKADVIVCDGFVGNIVLKFAEGMGSALFSLIKREAGLGLRRKIGAVLVKPALKAVKQVMDYSEYGGAPLLGLKGITIISHGRSNAKAIRNAIAAAKKAAEVGLVQTITDSVMRVEEGIGIE